MIQLLAGTSERHAARKALVGRGERSGSGGVSKHGYWPRAVSCNPVPFGHWSTAFGLLVALFLMLSFVIKTETLRKL